MKLTTLGQSATDLLDQFVTELTNLGVDLPLPRYLGPGEIAWDAPSLTMYLGTVAVGQPGQPVASSLAVASLVETTVQLFVQILRNVSMVGLSGGRAQVPSPTVQATEGLAALDDAGALMAAAINIKANYSAVAPGSGFGIGQIVPLGPMGGMAGVRLEITLSIDGL